MGSTSTLPCRRNIFLTEMCHGSVQNVGTSTVRRIVRSSTDATVERSLIQHLIHGLCRTPVAKSVAVHWGRTVAIHATFFVTRVHVHLVPRPSKWRATARRQSRSYGAAGRQNGLVVSRAWRFLHVVVTSAVCHVIKECVSCAMRLLSKSAAVDVTLTFCLAAMPLGTVLR